jgi:hypothetical protein
MLAEFPEAKQIMDKWDINVVEVYTLVNDQPNMEKTSAKINSVLNGRGRTDHPELLLYPLNRWHLYAEFTNGKNTVAVLYSPACLESSVFCVVLACINFMNLSTARSERRAREVVCANRRIPAHPADSSVSGRIAVDHQPGNRLVAGTRLIWRSLVQSIVG